MDAHGRVGGLADVYAAGDVTTFPVEQAGSRPPGGGARGRVVVALVKPENWEVDDEAAGRNREAKAR